MNDVPGIPNKELDLSDRANMPKVGKRENGK